MNTDNLVRALLEPSNDSISVSSLVRHNEKISGIASAIFTASGERIALLKISKKFPKLFAMILTKPVDTGQDFVVHFLTMEGFYARGFKSLKELKIYLLYTKKRIYFFVYKKGYELVNVIGGNVFSV